MTNKLYLQISKQIFNSKTIYFLIIVLLLAERCIVGINFNFKITDDDQSLMNYAAFEFSKGHFHEPCFFGQNYNSHFEALLAVPLIWLKVSPYIATPIISGILSLLPYILISLLAGKKLNYFIASICLLFPLLLPIEYSMITSMPRGFITGIALSGVGIFLLFNSPFKKNIILASFCFGFAVYLNPNSVILSIPVIIYWILTINFNLKKIMVAVFGGGIGLLLLAFSKYFYFVNPNYVVHPAWVLHFSIQNLLLFFQNIPLHFKYLGPFEGNIGYIVLFIVLGLGIISIILKNKVACITIFFFLLFLIFSFSLNKVFDGKDDIFLPLSRMYLALPVVVSFFIYVLFKHLNVTSMKPTIFLFLIIIPISIFKFVSITTIIDNSLSELTYTVIPENVDVLKSITKNLNSLANENNATLIIVDEKKPTFSYCFPVLSHGELRTLTNRYERRYWRKIQERKLNDKNIILISNSSVIKGTVEKLGLQIERSSLIIPAYIIRGNRLSNYDLAMRLKDNI